MSLCGPGAETERGVSTTTPAGGGKSGGPAGRGLSLPQPNTKNTKLYHSNYLSKVSTVIRNTKFGDAKFEALRHFFAVIKGRL